MSASIFEGVLVKVQKGILKLLNGAEIHSGTVDPTVVAVSAPKGSLYLSTDTGKVFRKADNGLSLVWIDISVATLQPLNKVVSASSGIHLMSSPSFTDVPNLTAVITTSGRPVDIQFVPDPSGLTCIYLVKDQPWGLSIGLDYKILRGATVVSTGRIFYREADTSSPGAFDSHSLLLPVGGLNCVDDGAAAGTHTYKVQVAAIGGLGTVGIQYAKLRLREE